MNETDDIIDAEFVTIADGTAKTGAKAGTMKGSAAKTSNDDGQLELFRNAKSSAGGSLREELVGRQRMSLPVFTLVAAVMSGAAFILAGGYTLFLPAAALGTPVAGEASAGPVAAGEPLAVENVQLSHSDRGGRTVLTVRARIVNKSASEHVVPALVISFSGGSGQRSYLIPRGETLQAGEQMAFTSRLPVDEIPAADPLISFDR